MLWALSANSLNPETGLPEFFLSKIAKGVKRAFGSVGKVLKKVAPVVLPIAVDDAPRRCIWRSCRFWYRHTMQGGSLEDAMKNAVIAGGTGAIFKGFQGGEGSFGETSVRLADPGARFSALGQGLTGEAPLFQSYSPSTATATATPQYEVGFDAAKNSVSALNPPPPATTTDPSFLDRAKDFIMPENVSTTDALKQMGVNPAEATATQLEIAKEMAAEQSPGFIRRYGPSLDGRGLAQEPWDS